MPTPSRLEFIYLLRLSRAEAFAAPTPEEEASIEAHFQHLQEAQRQGCLVLAGPCLDGAFGVVILHASSSEEACAFMESDPAVRDGVMKAELHPFHVSLPVKT
ncbi:MAG: YciI family protein [Coprothermobacterota bacterium]|nr:YciI family protein [Coprothermobacterota bacterium]